MNNDLIAERKYDETTRQKIRYSQTVIIDRQQSKHEIHRKRTTQWTYGDSWKISMKKRADKPRCSFKAFKLIEIIKSVTCAMNLNYRKQTSEELQQIWRWRLTKVTCYEITIEDPYSVCINTDTQEMKHHGHKIHKDES